MRPKRKFTVTLFIGLCLVPVVIAQYSADTTIKVVVLDGRSGQPIPNEGFLVFVGTPTNNHARSVHLTTSKEGSMTVPATGQNLHVEVFPDRQALCYSDPNTRKFQVADITAKGVSAPNGCGSANAALAPGRLTVFARPAHWWEKAGW